MIFNKGTKAVQWQKGSLFNKWYWNNWISTCKKLDFEPKFVTYWKIINSKWIIELNIKFKTNTYRKKLGIKPLWPLVSQRFLRHERHDHRRKKLIRIIKIKNSDLQDTIRSMKKQLPEKCKFKPQWGVYPYTPWWLKYWRECRENNLHTPLVGM